MLLLPKKYWENTFSYWFFFGFFHFFFTIATLVSSSMNYWTALTRKLLLCCSGRELVRFPSCQRLWCFLASLGSLWSSWEAQRKLSRDFEHRIGCSRPLICWKIISQSDVIITYNGPGFTSKLTPKDHSWNCIIINPLPVFPRAYFLDENPIFEEKI